MILISIIIALVIERLGARAIIGKSVFMPIDILNTRKTTSEKGLFNSPILLIWLMLLVVAAGLVYQLSDFIIWQLAVNVAVLLVCFGCAKQRALYKSYLNALTRNDQEAVTLCALQMGQKKTEDEPQGETFGQTLAWLTFAFIAQSFFGLWF